MISMWHGNAKLQSVMTALTVKKLVVVAILMIVLIIKVTLQCTCNNTSSTEICEQRYRFYLHNSPSSYLFSFTQIMKIVVGPVSWNLYFLALIQDSMYSSAELTTIVKL